MYIPQKQIGNLRQRLSPGKVVIIYGARRVGKTTLLRKFLETETEHRRVLVEGIDLQSPSRNRFGISTDEAGNIVKDGCEIDDNGIYFTIMAQTGEGIKVYWVFWG